MNIIKVLIIAFLALVTGSFCPSAEAQYVWRPIEGPYEGIESIAYGNGVFVALSKSGLVFRSEDEGETWTSSSSGVGVRMGRKVIFDGTRFCLVGEYSFFAATSTDGASWTAIKMDPAGNTSDFVPNFGELAAYSDGTYYVTRTRRLGGLSFNTIASTSRDLVHWTEEYEVPWSADMAVDGSRVVFNTVGFVKGKFIRANPDKSLSVSVNGVDWQNVPAQSFQGEYRGNALEFGGRIVLLTTAGFLHSADGSLFSLSPIPEFESTLHSPTAMATNGSRLVIGTSSGTMWIAEDLASVVPAEHSSALVDKIAFHGGSLQAHTPQALMTQGADAVTLVAATRTIHNGHTSDLVSRRFSDGAVGDWLQSDLPPEFGLSYSPQYIGNELYIFGGRVADSRYVVYSSPNLSNWSAKGDYYAVNAQGKRVQPVNTSPVLLNGALWNRYPLEWHTGGIWEPHPSVYGVRDIIYANGKYHALGENSNQGEWLQSIDGVNFSSFKLAEADRHIFALGSTVVIPSQRASSSYVVQPDGSGHSVPFSIFPPNKASSPAPSLYMFGTAGPLLFAKDGVSESESQSASHTPFVLSTDGVQFHKGFGLPNEVSHDVYKDGRPGSLALVKAGSAYFAVTNAGIILRSPEAAEEDIPAAAFPEQFVMTKGVAFTHTLALPAGVKEVLVSNLPSGISFNGQSGTFSGVPTQVEAITCWLTLITEKGLSRETILLGVGAPAAPVVTSEAAAAGTRGKPFSYQITTDHLPTSYGATGLPAGIMVDRSTGLISGTPTVNGAFQINLTATNESGSGSKALSLIISDPVTAVPMITSDGAASAVQGYSFNYQIAASNSPVIYSATGLPLGLTVDSATGLIAGAPAISGTFELIVSAGNVVGLGTKALSLTVTAAPKLAPAITSDTRTITIRKGELFKYQITATNSPRSFSSSTLPDGLSLSLGGAIRGQPTIMGEFEVIIRASNAMGEGSAALAIRVVSESAILPPQITSSSSAMAQKRKLFAYQITAINSPTRYTTTKLPKGLKLKSHGRIIGKPARVGTYNVAITAKNAAGYSSQQLQIVVTKH